MNNKILVPVLSSAIAALSAQADWTVVSTFDDASALSIVTDVTNIEASNARSEIVDGRLACFPGDLFEATSNLYAMIDLGVDLRAASIAAGGPVTAYIEVIQPTIGDHKAIVDTVWGLSNATPDSVLAGDPNRFNAYNVMQRINSGTDGWEVLNKDAGGANAYQPIGIFTADTVYSIWMVVDYTLNFWECYVQGGQWTEQTRLNTVDETGIYLFRTNPAVDGIVKYAQISLSRGNASAEKGIDPTYFDNLAIDTSGQNLTKPATGGGFGKWGPWDVVDAAGNVDTGSWMGWVNTAFKPYIWSYSLSSYMYIDEGSITAGGSWVYVFN